MLREEFHMPPGKVYLCGNSLGLQPKATQHIIDEELEEWRLRGVEGHVKGRRPWVTADEEAARLSAVLVGASPAEVAIMNSLTVNLHLLMVAFYTPTDKRNLILIEDSAFPSDLYAAQSQARMHGYGVDSVVRVAASGGGVVTTDDFVTRVSELGERVALVLLPAVQYYSGVFFDILRISRVCKEYGIVLGVDAAHAVGNVPLRFHDWGVDFASWCSYKYLNAGPGSIGGAFVHEKHHAGLKNRNMMAGWWGHELSTRFDMRQPFTPEPGAMAFRLSNPPVLPLVCLLASLRLFDKITMPALRVRSLELTGLLVSLVQEADQSHDLVRIITPDDPERRGCQVSLLILGGLGRPVAEKLENEGIVVDFREPDVIRVSPAPLYNTEEDVRTFVRVLRNVLTKARHEVVGK